MNRVYCLTLVLLGSFNCQGWAIDGLEKIAKAREAVLEQILEVTKNQPSVNAEQLRKDNLALLSFRRDNAKSSLEQARWQERIVALEEEAKLEIHNRVLVGTMTPTEFLRTEERYLAAMQKLLEIRSGK